MSQGSAKQGDNGVEVHIPHDGRQSVDEKSQVLRLLRPLVGDMQQLDAFLDARGGRSTLVCMCADIITTTLRAIGQVIFVNSPLGGALILIGLMCSSVFTGLAALVSVTSALLVSKVLALPSRPVRAGLSSFSACLLGTVTVELVPLLYGRPLSAAIFLWVILMSALSVPLGDGLSNILGKVRLPAFTLPFNVVVSVLFVCIGTASSPPAAAVQTTNSTAPLPDQNTILHWDQVMLGSVYSMGQVYAAHSLPGSILMYTGCLLCSPILTAASYVGALTGTMLGVAFSTESYSSVYSGVWGYNGILAAEAIMFFIVPSPRAVLLAVLNAVFATMVQAALGASLSQIGLPVFTFPFVISTLMMLAVTSGPGLQRVSKLRIPELHCRERLGTRQAARESGAGLGVMQDINGDMDRL